jgi:hypothetical protein
MAAADTPDRKRKKPSIVVATGAPRSSSLQKELTMNRILGALTIATQAVFPTYVAALLWAVLLIRDGVRAALVIREAT